MFELQFQLKNNNFKTHNLKLNSRSVRWVHAHAFKILLSHKEEEKYLCRPVTMACNTKFSLILSVLIQLAIICNKVLKCEGDSGFLPQCNTVITIDQTRGENCGGLSLIRIRGSTCSNLQEVLNILKDFMEEDNNCIEIVISEGNYLISEDIPNIAFNKNIYIHNNANDTVSINLQVSEYTFNTSFFKSAISFRDSDFAIIEGIHFTGSKCCVVSFDNVSRVGVISSTFR